MRRLAPIGVAAALFGFVTLVDRGLAGALDVNYLVVSGVGALAVAVGAWYAYGARSTPRRTADVDAPESRYRAGVPAGGVETALAAGGRIGAARRADLRRRLREVAVDVLVAHGGHDRPSAVRAVEAGTWTDDPVAAGYLAEPQALPRRWRLRKLVRRRATARACVERSLHALEEVRAP